MDHQIAEILKLSPSINEINIQNQQYSTFSSIFKKLKYPTYSVSSARSLIEQIGHFNIDPENHEQFFNQLGNYNSFRRIRGDGNCFFRAVSFSYISYVSSPLLGKCFQEISAINLAPCKIDSIPHKFRKFYNANFLKFMLVQNWEKSYRKCLMDSQDNHRVALIKLFDEYPYLDFICVLYFRAVCLKGLWLHRDRLKEFLVGNEEEAIRTYSEETEGVSINICSVMLRVLIHVYEVRKGKVLTYHYDQVEKPKDEIHLLFYENHYDLLEINDKIEQQKGSLTQKMYYSSINKCKKTGICIQCNIQKEVYSEYSICQKCFIKNQDRLKEKSIKNKEICKICNKVIIYNGIGNYMCESCQFLTEIKSNQVNRIQFSNGKCRKCKKKQKNLITQIDICIQCFSISLDQQEKSKVATKNNPNSIGDKCINCELFNDKICSQTGLCSRCRQQIINAEKDIAYLKTASLRQIGKQQKMDFWAGSNKTQSNSSICKGQFQRDNNQKKTTIAIDGSQKIEKNCCLICEIFIQGCFQDQQICFQCKEKQEKIQKQMNAIKDRRQNIELQKDRNVDNVEQGKDQERRVPINIMNTRQQQKIKINEKPCKKCHKVLALRFQLCQLCILKYFCLKCNQIKAGKIVEGKCLVCRN